MTITFSTRNFVRAIIFLSVFGLVMSIALLVEAREVPEESKIVSDTTVSAVIDDVDSIYELTDVPDGLASWYGKEFQGRRTASGRRFDMHEFTAAHRTLPFGSLIKVINPANGRTIFVEVTDRGPFIRKRVVDLSAAAARALGINVTPVTLEALTKQDVADFYSSNDSTVLAINKNNDIVVLTRTTLRVNEDGQGLTSALTSCNDENVVVVKPSEKAAFTFHVASPLD